MADKALSKTIFKKTARVKEKLYERLGKADRTTDEIFEEQAKHFESQHKDVDKFHEKFKHYVSCLRASHSAKKEFCESVREIYETDWPGQEHIRAMTQSLELLSEEHGTKLHDEALTPLSGYCSQFPDIKAKIEKRGRKLLDYDNARHNLEALETGNNKQKNDIKIQKANLELQEAKRHYEDINDELLEGLPKLYDGRVNFAAANLETIFNLEATFHAETAKLCKDLAQQLTRLATVASSLSNEREKTQQHRLSSEGSLKHDNISPKVPPSPVRTSHKTPPHPAEDAQPAAPETKKRLSKKPADAVVDNGPVPADADKNGTAGAKTSDQSSTLYPEVPLATENIKENGAADETEGKNPFDSESPPEKSLVDGEAPAALKEATMTEHAHVESEDKSENKDEPVVLYWVKATHKYTREDVDELSFETGELIKVVEFDNDPEDQDPGWLMGIKDSTGEKGVFPENFTTRI